MTIELRGDPGGRRLNTWKEIAGYFGCDERTVKRWEASRRLPVRRLPNGPRSAVFAYESELRAWLDDANAVDSTAGRNQAEELREASIPVLSPRHGGLVLSVVVAVGVLAGLAALRVAFPAGPGGSPPASTAVHVANAETQALYRAGLFAWQTRTPAGLAQAVDDFTQAIVHDPQYAEAYAGLADCYNLMREFTTTPPEYAYPRAKAAAERAIALKPSLSGAHAALAFVDFYWLRDAGKARSEFHRALALSPDNAIAHHWYATFLLATGAFSQALEEIGRAEALDTASSAIQADKGLILFYDGQPDAAVTLLRQLEQAQPAFASPHHYLAIIERARGNDGAFLEELSAFAAARLDDTDRAIADSGTAGLAGGGHRGMLQAMLGTQKRLFEKGAFPAYALAETAAELGEPAAALAYLQTSIARREPANIGLAIEPAFAPLRTSLAFRALVSANNNTAIERHYLR